MWTPLESTLSDIVQLLNESHSPDTEVQRSVEQVREYPECKLTELKWFCMFFRDWRH